MTEIAAITTCPTCRLVYVPKGKRFSQNLGHHRQHFQWDEHGEAFVVCDVCGMSYVLPENETEHRKFHMVTLKAIRPQRDKRFGREPDLRDGLLPVTAKSKQFLHNCMLHRATAFKREFRYDFVQWPAGRETDPNTCGYLFVNGDDVAVGACRFQFGMWEGHLNSWSLEWVWIAPIYRRIGALSQRWKTLQRNHGDFFNAPPLSPAFEAFLLKQGASVGEVG